MQHYDAFAAMFAGNPHVRLLARILYHSDLYGGDPRDSIDRILQDVMRDRLDDERNQSETAASMTIALLLNLGIIAIATHNLLMPSLAAVLIETTEGRLLLALAVLLCMFSIRLTRKIISS